MSAPRRLMVVHNRYTQRGGEDTVVDGEVAALRDRGHEVELLEVENTEVGGLGAAARAVWSPASARMVARRSAAFTPDVVHVHNHSYRLSPSIYPALAASGAPVVATLHNFRTTCSNALLLRDGAPCELCVGSRAAWHGVRHSCFRGSRAGSAAMAGMQLAYRRAGVPSIARWLVLTEHARGVFERAGLPADRLVVRPNTVADHGVGEPLRAPVALFVGRLSPEKGVDVLLAAWASLAARGALPTDARLVVAGDGPHAGELRRLAAGDPSVELLGAVPTDRVHELMRSARVAVVPSRWYETFGMVALEAFAAATPAIVSDHGALAELVAGGEGWRVEPGNVDALAAALAEALGDAHEAARRGALARATWQGRYAPERVMAQLEGVYETVIGDALGAP